MAGMLLRVPSHLGEKEFSKFTILPHFWGENTQVLLQKCGISETKGKNEFIVTSLFCVHNITYILYSISQQVHYCFGHFDDKDGHECINFTISPLLLWLFVQCILQLLLQLLYCSGRYTYMYTIIINL